MRQGHNPQVEVQQRGNVGRNGGAVFFFFLKLLPWRDELSKKQQNGSTRECVQKMIRICMWRTLAHKAAPCKCACVSLSGCDTDPCGGCRVHRSNEQRFLHSEKKKGGKKARPPFFPHYSAFFTPSVFVTYGDQPPLRPYY